MHGVVHPRGKITPDPTALYCIFCNHLGFYQRRNSPDNGSSITSPEANTSFPLCFVYPVRGGSHSASPADGKTSRIDTKTTDTKALGEPLSRKRSFTMYRSHQTTGPRRKTLPQLQDGMYRLFCNLQQKICSIATPRTGDGLAQLSGCECFLSFLLALGDLSTLPLGLDTTDREI